ncbi:amidohydrolase [Mangrovimonas xylaniphaga]|uniref:amidohydrolase n=1 Tax=Mangrovimonas xylaniphaga TaxID=1645915 RepID=UPI0006B56E7F|nr:amidohydrolase [Mangrovimonas xylaniphaga]
MQDQLKVAFIQQELAWENPKQNRKQFKEAIEGISQKVDLILLPEMFTTGFTMNAKEQAETMDGKSVDWMKKLASAKDAAIVGSLIIEDNSKIYNRLLFVHPDGTIEHYDKRHTFSLAGEDKVYASGMEKLIVDYHGWKICPLICYDLRFPVWSRNKEDYELLLYVANWPKPRIVAWDTLLKARAIENMCYTVGVNRVGVDEKDNEYCGHSTAYDILGNNISPIRPNKEYVGIITLERNHLNFYRNKLKFLNDRDTFLIQ